MKKPNGCHNCRFLDIASGGLTKTGRLKNVGYRCTWVMPDIAWPESWDMRSQPTVPRFARWPTKGDGENCRAWEAREDGP